MMQVQNEITREDDLLDTGGDLRHAGWSRGVRLRYRRADVNVPKQRVKEWEHYTVLTAEYAIGLTLVQLGRFGAAQVEVMRLSDGEMSDGMDLVLTRSLQLPASPYVEQVYESRTRHVQFEIHPGSRRVRFDFGRKGLSGDIELSAPAPGEGLAVSTPFGAPNYFFYEYKVPDLRASGWVKAHGTREVIADDSAHAVFDWGRGAWPKNSHWLWGWGAGWSGDRRVSFNLGGGFGDMRSASENAVVVDGTLHKLGRVDWRYDEDRRTEPWTFEDDAGRLALTFEPCSHRVWDQQLLVWSAHLDKVFGHFSGTAVLDDGSEITIERVAGFAEEMTQKW